MYNIRKCEVTCSADWDNPCCEMAWHAQAEFSDGGAIERWFPYTEDGNYNLECKAQYEIECWLLEMASLKCETDDVVLEWYSVNVEEV